MNPLLLAAGALTLCAAVPALAAQESQWPGFRGPNHNGVALAGNPPTEWGDEKNLAWKLELPGPGASSPIVVGDRIYVTCYTGYGHYLDDGGAPKRLALHLTIVDRNTGKLIANTTIPGEREKEAPRMQLVHHGFATPTPATNGKRIFAYFGTAGVVAFDLDGKTLWQRSTGTMPPGDATPTNQVIREGKALKLRWGAASSPVLCDGLVLVNASEESNSIRAFDQKTGELRWKYESPNLEGCASSPVIAGVKDARVLVVGLGGEVWGIDPETGKLAWRVETGTRGGMSPTPVSDGELVYTFGGLGKSFALRLGEIDASEFKKPDPKTEEEADTEPESEQGIVLPKVPYSPRIAWKSNNLDIPSPVLFNDMLFLVSQSGTASCLSKKDGAEIFKGRLDGRTGSVYASPIVAGGCVYVVSRKRGTFVYSADGKFKLIAQNKIDDEAQFNASPAIVGDRVYLRSDKFLYCIAGS